MWGNVGRIIKLDEAEFIGISPLSGDSRLTVEALTVLNGVKSFFE